MNRVILILAALAAWTATAATPNRTATEAYVTNKIAAAIAALPPPDFSTNNVELVETIQDAAPVPDYSTNNAELVVTIQTKAPAPGNYETVSNRAMTALQSHQSLEPSTNYTDAALAEFAATGTVARALTYGTPTRWVDATGCVWECGFTAWTMTYPYSDVFEFSSSSNGVFQWANEGSVLTFTPPTTWTLFIHDGNAMFTAGKDTLILEEGEFLLQRPNSLVGTNLVGRVALTNDIPTVDYTQSNTQLVATIEATAPAPGNYSTVSNAAMNARTKADMAVYTNAVGFTDWTFRGDGSQNANDALEGASPIVGDYDESIESWFIVGLSNGYEQAGPTGGDRNSTTIEFYVLSDDDLGTACTITATRSIINIPIATGDELSTTGYVASVIGDIRTDIPDTSGFATPADVTAAIREQSLGGIWDQQLGVWWTPHMANGAYYWTATTNVDLNAEGNQ